MTKPLRVLLIEDSESDAALVRRALEHAGYDIYAQRVEDARGTRNALANEHWDLLISDYRLDAFDAPGALRILQETGRDIPFIVVSGTIGDELAVEIMKNGAHDYLVKDNPGRLAQAVEREVREAYVRRSRIQAEEALRESEARLKLALTAAGMGVWEWNLVTNQVFWSPEIYENFDLAGGDGTLADFQRLVHPEDLPGVMEATRRAIEARTVFSSEFRVLTSSGNYRWVSNYGRARYDYAGNPLSMTGTVKDITRERNDKEALHESEDMLNSIVSSALDAVIVVDAKGDVLLWNTAAERIFGFAQCEALGKGLHELITPPEHHDQFIRGFAEYRQTGHGLAIGKTLELTALRRDGTRFPAELSVATLNVRGSRHSVGVVRDITERKRAEEALRESEQRWQFALEGSGDGVWDWDAVHNTTYFSGQWKAMLGYEGQEIGNRPGEFESRLHPDDRELNRKAMADYIAGLTPSYSSEYRLKCKDGSYKWILGRGKVVTRTLDGTPLRVIGTHADVTPLKQAVEEREKIHAKYLQAQKLESIGRLAGGVAHDFNNLLTVINGYAAITLRKLEADHASRAAVEEIYRAGERATALVQQLLTFSRKNFVKPEVLEMNELINGMVRMASCLLRDDVNLASDLKPDLGHVLADRHQMEQVIMNLVVNARDAMPDGGTVTIETAHKWLEGHCVNCSRDIKPGTYMRVTVRDTGTGMDEHVRQHLFEPFFTTKEPGKGTGLGLSVVHGIVVQSGGHITVESTLGLGSAFHVDLPLVDAPAALEQSAPLEEAGGGETVLIVEDEPEVRRYAATVLEALGYVVWQEGDGASALSRLAKQKPDLLLTDVVMPKLGGRELAIRARQMYPALKVLFMSGYSGSSDSRFRDLTKSEAFLQKPFDPHTLGTKLREVLATRPLARVLVVDDEAQVRQYLCAVLSEAGYEVVEAANGKQALAHIRNSQPSLVITDLVMPEQEGIETIRILRRDHPEIRVIAISGAAKGKYLDLAKPLGADATLAKPVAPELLLEEVKRVLEG